MSTRVYAGGPINGCTDDEANGWRDKLRSLLPEFEIVDPMVRDYRGREDECVNEIVELDKADIVSCSVGVFYCWQVSWGTAMEIHFAHLCGVDSVVVVPDGTRISPWLRYHSVGVVATLEEAALLVRSLH